MSLKIHSPALYCFIQLQKDTRKYHFCPFEGCNRAVKKPSQHLQYKHPDLIPAQRRKICEKAKVAPGKGALKPTRRAPTQPTILSILVQEKSGEEDESQQEREDERDEDEDAVMGGVEEEFNECGRVNIEETKESSDEEDVVMAGTEEGATESGRMNSEQIEESSDELEEDVVLAGTEEEVKEFGFANTKEGEVRSGEEGVVEMSAHILPDHTFLVGLRRHLMSRHGKGRSEREAKQISSDVAKFLYFSSPTLDPSNLYNVKKLDNYLKYLEGQDRAASTQHAILCRIKQGLAYVNLSLGSEETLKAEKCSKLIANWLATLGKEARRVKRIHLEDISDKADTRMSEIERFSMNKAMATSLYNAVEKAKKGKKIPQVDIRQIMIWLAGSLLHLNAQRPGAITNTTLEEYRAATEPQDCHHWEGEIDFWSLPHKASRPICDTVAASARGEY